MDKREQQAEQGLKLVRLVAKQCSNPRLGIHADELIGAGVDALMEALPSKMEFPLLGAIIRRRIIDFKRKIGPYTRQGNLRGSLEGKRKQLEGYRRWRSSLTEEQKAEIARRSVNRKWEAA